MAVSPDEIKSKPALELSENDKFLQDFVDKSKAPEPAPAPTEDDLLAEVAKTDGTKTKLHKRAKEKNAADTQAEEAAKAKKEAERLAEERRRDLENRQGKIVTLARTSAEQVRDNAINPALDKAGQAVQRFSELQTIGGIGLLLFIIFFLLFIVIPVNDQGDTRIKLLWYMLNGRTELQGRQTIQQATATTATTASTAANTAASAAVATTAGLPGIIIQDIESLYRNGLF